eukprot:COSAG05_NODE_1323_length_5188_cov_14.398900_4_plen_97_part_00
MAGDTGFNKSSFNKFMALFKLEAMKKPGKYLIFLSSILYLTSILYIYLRLTPTESLQGGGRFTCFRSHNEPQHRQVHTQVFIYLIYLSIYLSILPI